MDVWAASKISVPSPSKCCCSGTITFLYEFSLPCFTSHERSILAKQIQIPHFKLLLQQSQDNRSVVKGSKRGQFDVMADVLLFCHKEKLKTRIMNETNLNHSQLQNYLKNLESRGLLTEVGWRYVTTEKGFRFLELFDGIHRILEE